MRHRKIGRKFGRESHQRKALFRSLCTSLVKYERIETTLHKAKDLRRQIEKAISVAKRLHAAKGETEQQTKAIKAAKRTIVTIRIQKIYRDLISGPPFNIHSLSSTTLQFTIDS